MEVLARPIIPILEAFASWTGSFGVAIILLTLLIRGIMLPFQIKGLRSMARMRELQPQLDEIKERFKDNPQEMNQRMMKVYQDNQINPLGGCLPTLVQMPVIFGLYQAMRIFPERLADNPALVDKINMTLFGLDLTQSAAWGEWANLAWILALLAAVTSFLSTMAAPGMGNQKTMFAPLALFTGYLGFVIPSGLMVYITVTNLFTIMQHYIVQMQGIEVGRAPADEYQKEPAKRKKPNKAKP